MNDISAYLDAHEKKSLLRHGSAWLKARVTALNARIDVNTLARTPAEELPSTPLPRSPWRPPARFPSTPTPKTAPLAASSSLTPSPTPPPVLG